MYRILLGLCLTLGVQAHAQGPQPIDCEASPEQRQFDFWLGDWEVTDKAGETVYGHNTISKQEKGCYLSEEWRSAQGGSGSSMNYYDPSNDQWHQLWLDAGFSIIQTAGGIEDGAMVMTGTIHYLQADKTAKFRGSWIPLEDGRVRQFFEQVNKDGEWQTWFDGYYRRTD